MEVVPNKNNTREAAKAAFFISTENPFNPDKAEIQLFSIIKMKHKGFTLVELMIAVVILAILAAIALPAYNDYVEEARLTSAKSSALSIKPYLEEHFLETGSHFNSSSDTYNGETVDFTWSTESHSSGYKITISAEKDYSFSRDMKLLN